MSRSFKKPWIKDPVNSYMKKIHARKERRKVKTILKVFIVEKENWDIGPSIPDSREITNPYSICDFIFYCSEISATRK